MKEKRTSQGRERGLSAFMMWGIPSTYTSQLEEKRRVVKLWMVRLKDEHGYLLALTDSRPPFPSAPAVDCASPEGECLQRLSGLEWRIPRKRSLRSIKVSTTNPPPQSKKNPHLFPLWSGAPCCHQSSGRWGRRRRHLRGIWPPLWQGTTSLQEIWGGPACQALSGPVFQWTRSSGQ